MMKLYVFAFRSLTATLSSWKSLCQQEFTSTAVRFTPCHGIPDDVNEYQAIDCINVLEAMHDELRFEECISSREARLSTLKFVDDDGSQTKIFDISCSAIPIAGMSIHFGLFHAFTLHTAVPGQPPMQSRNRESATLNGISKLWI